MHTSSPLLALGLISFTLPLDDDAPPRLRVSDKHRFLITTEGRPFLLLADTAWQLIHDLDKSEMCRYFAD